MAVTVAVVKETAPNERRVAISPEVVKKLAKLGASVVIQTGAVRIAKRMAGEEKVLAVLGPGEFLGEMAILNGKPRTATATVVEPTRCLLIDARTLETMPPPARATSS